MLPNWERQVVFYYTKVSYNTFNVLLKNGIFLMSMNMPTHTITWIGVGVLIICETWIIRC